jgi:hypothetical protein
MTGSINGREVVRHLRGVRVFWVAAVSISKSLVGGEGSSVIFVIRVPLSRLRRGRNSEMLPLCGYLVKQSSPQGCDVMMLWVVSTQTGAQTICAAICPFGSVAPV